MRKALVLLLLVACVPPPKTQAEACRRRVAGNRFSRSFSTQNTQALSAIEDGQCDAIEAQERAAAASQRQHAELVEAVRQPSPAPAPTVATDEGAAERKRIRARPVAPELGSTPKEVRQICTQQWGYIEDSPSLMGCMTSEGPIFAVGFKEGLASRVDTLYEGGDLAAMRDAETAKRGEPTVTIEDGVRLFTWPGGVSMSTYAKGVRKSVRISQ